MCKEDEFCPNADLDVRQLIFINKNYVGEADPKKAEDQAIYAALVKAGLIELVKVGTHQPINLWPLVSQIVIPWPGKLHAELTETGRQELNKLTQLPFQGAETNGESEQDL
jgi:hypothetical protein